jgi:hypothetical protein
MKNLKKSIQAGEGGIVANDNEIIEAELSLIHASSQALCPLRDGHDASSLLEQVIERQFA